MNSIRPIDFAKRALFGGLAATLLVSCAYEGSYENPVARKFSWFSYLSGDDIRAACKAGAPERIRLVYNAIYTEQVRSYDIAPSAEPGRFDLTARVTGTADLSTVSTSFEAPDPFKPWRPAKSVTSLRPEDLVNLKLALEADGFFAPTRVGLELPSQNFYWVGATCIDGHFHFNAFLWPKDRIDNFTFPKMLFAWDFTDVPVAKPRKATLFDIYGTRIPEDKFTIFTVKLAKNGLWRLGMPD